MPETTTKPKAPRKDTTRMSAACAIAAKHPDLAEQFAKVLGLPRGGRLTDAKQSCEAEEYAHDEKMKTLRAVRDFAAEVDPLDGPMLGGVKGAIDAARTAKK